MRQHGRAMTCLLYTSPYAPAQWSRAGVPLASAVVPVALLRSMAGEWLVRWSAQTHATDADHLWASAQTLRAWAEAASAPCRPTPSDCWLRTRSVHRPVDQASMQNPCAAFVPAFPARYFALRTRPPDYRESCRGRAAELLPLGPGADLSLIHI